jgi:hypothetical protein
MYDGGKYPLEHDLIADIDMYRGFFHLRLKFAPDDFVLLSPQDPDAGDSGLTPYQTSRKWSSWWFCNKCGVRCFTIRAPTEKAEVDAPTTSLMKLDLVDTAAASDSEKMPAWKLVREGFGESNQGGSNYFSLNAVTLDAHQNGLNLAEWHERQWVQYVDSLTDIKGWTTGKPHPGGIY